MQKDLFSFTCFLYYYTIVPNGIFVKLISHYIFVCKNRFICTYYNNNNSL